MWTGEDTWYHRAQEVRKELEAREMGLERVRGSRFEGCMILGFRA